MDVLSCKTNSLHVSVEGNNLSDYQRSANNISTSDPRLQHNNVNSNIACRSGAGRVPQIQCVGLIYYVIANMVFVMAWLQSSTSLVHRILCLQIPLAAGFP